VLSKTDGQSGRWPYCQVSSGERWPLLDLLAQKLYYAT
jgi:hypothetical protein